MPVLLHRQQYVGCETQGLWMKYLKWPRMRFFAVCFCSSPALWKLNQLTMTRWRLHMIILLVAMSVLKIQSTDFRCTSQPAVAVTVEPAEDNTVDICYNVGSKDPVAGPSSASQRTRCRCCRWLCCMWRCSTRPEPSAMILRTTCQSCK